MRKGLPANSRLAGSLACLLTVVVWGTTVVSTKVLLQACTPVEILLIRFLLALAALCVVCPRRLKGTTLRQELWMALAGLCGMCLYYLLENFALVYTSAGSVGVITSFAPFFTALFSWLLLKEARPTLWYSVGFVVAIMGICLMTFSGSRFDWNRPATSWHSRPASPGARTTW